MIFRYGKRVQLLFIGLLVLSNLFVLAQELSQNAQFTCRLLIKDAFGFPITNAQLSFQGMELAHEDQNQGIYDFVLPTIGNYKWVISAQGYETVIQEIAIKTSEPLHQLEIIMELLGNASLGIENQEAMLLSDTDITTLTDDSPSSFLLQATRDVFVASAAFDFSQAFFKPKALDSRYGMVLLNGVAMNKLSSGRPQWSDWGGLNTLSRNQNYVHGIQSSASDFGGLLGTTSIDLSPSKLRPGLSFSSSLSNRSYALREMLSYVSPSKNGLSYALGGSYRGAKRGYMEGTPYLAYSFMGSMDFKWPNQGHFSEFSYLKTFNRRGRSAALTSEVSTLLGREYNPYWGIFKGQIRAARNKTLRHQMIILRHTYTNDFIKLSAVAAFQKGQDFRGRLAYFNAPNPDPIYYRNLPSYYINSPIGANFFSAQVAAGSLKANPQINWDQMYAANRNSSAQITPDNSVQLPYTELGDQIQEQIFSATVRLLWKPTANQEFDFGVSYRSNPIEQYGEILDLLGGEEQKDIDPFSNTRNDVEGSLFKRLGDRFGYSYKILSQEKRIYGQWRHNGRHLDAFASFSARELSASRIGYMQNQRFLETSLGVSQTKNMGGFLFKGGFSYKFSGRHRVLFSSFFGGQPPVLSQWFINPREQADFSPNLKTEKTQFIEMNYFIRVPKLLGRMSLFYGNFKDQASLGFYFAETALGSDFVQEWISGKNTRHIGLEFGFAYKVSTAVTVNFSGSLGKYTIQNNPNMSLFFVPDPLEREPINQIGFEDFGAVKLAGTALPQGPARAFSLGVSYRDPKYWWLSASLNSMGLSYVSPSLIRRTDNFNRPHVYEESPDFHLELPALIKQKALPSFFIFNLVGGKSWLRNGRYTSIFLSVNNLFNSYFVSGGYEQSRKAHLKAYNDDQRSGLASFDTKYWQGSGRTFFLNLTLSIPPTKSKPK